MDRRTRPANDRVVQRSHAAEFPELTPVDPQERQIIVPSVDLRPRPDGPRDRQLLLGYDLSLLEQRDDWAFGTSDAAQYAGWLPAAALGQKQAKSQTVVGVRQTHAYSEPDFKSPERATLSLGAMLQAGETQGRFTQTDQGWVPSVHLTEIGAETDPITIAERLLGAPYLWGGDSAFGIDCSGLVHLAARLAGKGNWPGDSDMQQAAIGETLDPGTPPQRGDLMFWKGHVAWVSDAQTLIHANAHAMAVTHEPIAAAIARIAQTDGPVTRHARP